MSSSLHSHDRQQSHCVGNIPMKITLFVTRKSYVPLTNSISELFFYLFKYLLHVFFHSFHSLHAYFNRSDPHSRRKPKVFVCLPFVWSNQPFAINFKSVFINVFLTYVIINCQMTWNTMECEICHQNPTKVQENNIYVNLVYIKLESFVRLFHIVLTTKQQNNTNIIHC